MTREFDLSDASTFQAALERAGTREKGNCFEDFAVGDVLEHDPGLTLTRHASETWAGQTLNHDPAYWRPDAARDRGFDDVPAHPDYVTAAVMGPTVEDLSEKGGYFLGRTNLRFHEHGISFGTTVRVRSEVLETATSSSRPDYGIVTWRTEGVDADTGDVLLSYERTNMIPRRDPGSPDETGDTDDQSVNGDESPDEDGDTVESGHGLPGEFVEPDGEYFEDFASALDRARERDAAVAYRHERGRTMDAVTVSQLPLMTLNTAKQHHDANAMAESPSSDLVAYGDVTRSTALGHARSDEATWREVGFDDERFHTFVTSGDTVYCFTRVLDVTDEEIDAKEDGDDRAGTVRFEHVAFNQHDEPVYSGRRTAAIRKR